MATASWLANGWSICHQRGVRAATPGRTVVLRAEGGLAAAIATFFRWQSPGPCRTPEKICYQKAGGIVKAADVAGRDAVETQGSASHKYPRGHALNSLLPDDATRTFRTHAVGDPPHGQRVYFFL